MNTIRALCAVVGILGGIFGLASVAHRVAPLSMTTTTTLSTATVASGQLGSPSPKEAPAQIVVTSTATTPLVPPSYTTPTSGFCVNSTATAVWVVEETATSTAGPLVDGPYCANAATCATGTIPIAGRAWARLAVGGPVTLSCRFVDVGLGYTSGAPKASGVDTSAFLRVDGANTMTGTLKAIAGGATLPGVTSVGDEDTGLFWQPNKLFATAGAVPVVTFELLGSPILGRTRFNEPALFSAGVLTRPGWQLGSNFGLTQQTGSEATVTISDTGIMRFATGGFFPVGPNRTLGDSTNRWSSGHVDRLTGQQLTTGTSNYWQQPTIINTSPTKPTCAAGATEGAILYSDDTDDLGGGVPCVCVAADAARTTFAWRQMQDQLAACP